MEKIAPGIYIDNDNELHLDVPQLLQAHGFADTEANRNAVIRAAVNIFDGVIPSVTVTVTNQPFKES